MNIVAGITSVAASFPAGTVPTTLNLKLTETTTQAVLTGSTPYGNGSITIDNVPPGTYVGEVTLTAADGTAIGAPVISNTIVVPNPEVTIDAPASVTLSLG